MLEKLCKECRGTGGEVDCNDCWVECDTCGGSGKASAGSDELDAWLVSALGALIPGLNDQERAMIGSMLQTTIAELEETGATVSDDVRALADELVTPEQPN